MLQFIVVAETAALAHEKGFDEECLYAASYNTQTEVYDLDSARDLIGEMFFNQSDINEAIRNNGAPCYLLPLQFQLQNWLLEEHNLWIHIVPYYGTEYNNEGVEAWELVCIQNVKTEENYPMGQLHFDTYKLCLEAGLQQALKLLKDVR